MDVEPEARRATLTLKKGLIDSKLPIVDSIEGARVGSRSHGWVSGITEAGIFVGFYNHVKGLVPPTEVSLPDGTTLQDAYTAGQVLKCSIIGKDSRKGLRLSLSRKGAAAKSSAADGDVVDAQVLQNAVVHKVEASKDDPEKAAAVYITAAVSNGGKLTARIAAEHLSDHVHAADALATAVSEGSVLPEVVVLETHPGAGIAVASRKASLVAAAKAHLLPCQLSELQPDSCVPGFIASITKDACFVRFGGGLTGRAGLPQLADAFVSDPMAHFAVGQSVLARILEVHEEQNRFTISLKPSAVGASSSALLECLFRCVCKRWKGHASLQSY